MFIGIGSRIGQIQNAVSGGVAARSIYPPVIASNISLYAPTAYNFPATYRTAGEGKNGSGGGVLTATLSPAPASGVLLIATHIENTGVTVAAPSTGTGAVWTEISTGTTSRVWYKVCNGTEPTSYTVTYSGASKSDAGAFSVIEIKGNNATPIDTNRGLATGTNIGPSITTQFDAELVLSIFTTELNTAVASTPTGWTEVQRVTAFNLNGAAGVCIASLQKGAKGATGTATWTGGTGTKLFTLGVKT